jgi:hypothetical protein
MTPRRSLLVQAIFFTPLMLGGLALVAYLVLRALDGADGGDIFLIVVVAVVTLLIGFQAITALLDFRSDPITTEGRVGHRWMRHDLVILGESCFIRVESEERGNPIFKIDRFWWEQIQTGDLVTVVHYPHTLAVESVEKVEALSSRLPERQPPC